MSNITSDGKPTPLASCELEGLQSSERTFREHRRLGHPEIPMFFSFPEDARWNAERQAVEFGVEIGEYRGVVRVPRHVFQRLLSERPTPEKCVEIQ